MGCGNQGDTASGSTKTHDHSPFPGRSPDLKFKQLTSIAAMLTTFTLTLIIATHIVQLNFAAVLTTFHYLTLTPLEVKIRKVQRDVGEQIEKGNPEGYHLGLMFTSAWVYDNCCGSQAQTSLLEYTI